MKLFEKKLKLQDETRMVIKNQAIRSFISS